MQFTDIFIDLGVVFFRQVLIRLSISKQSMKFLIFKCNQEAPRYEWSYVLNEWPAIPADR